MLAHPGARGEKGARLPRSFGALGADTEYREAGGKRERNTSCIINYKSRVREKGSHPVCLGTLKSHPHRNVHPIRRTKLRP